MSDYVHMGSVSVQSEEISKITKEHRLEEKDPMRVLQQKHKETRFVLLFLCSFILLSQWAELPPHPTGSSLTAVSQLNRDQSKPVVVDLHVERVSESLSLSPYTLPLSQFSGCLSCNNETSANTGHTATHTWRQRGRGLMCNGSLHKRIHLGEYASL